MTRTCTLCGAPVAVELARARSVAPVLEHMVARAPLGVALHRTVGPVVLVAHARCTDPLCGLLELIDLEAADQ